MRDSQKRYSFRKYRGIGLASVAIATLLFGLSVQSVAANDLSAQSASPLAAVAASDRSGTAIELPQGSLAAESVSEVTPVDSADQVQAPSSQPELATVVVAASVTAAGNGQADEAGQVSAPKLVEEKVSTAAVTEVEELTAPSVSAAGVLVAPLVSEVTGQTEKPAPQKVGAGEAGNETVGLSRVGFRSAALPLAPEREALLASAAGEAGADQVPGSRAAGDAERLAAVRQDLEQRYGQGMVYEDLTDAERARYEAAIYNEYANHLVENIFTTLRPAQTYAEIPFRESSPLFSKYVIEERQKVGNPPATSPEGLAAIDAARARVLAEYNKNLTHDPTVAGYTAQSPELVQSLIHRVVAGQGLGAIEAQKRNFFGGLYLLHSQYGFDERLPELLVTQSPVVTTTPPLAPVTAFDNLVRIGQQAITSQVRNKSDLGNLLGQNQAIFDRAIKPLTGLTSQLDLVEKLAQSKNQSATDYLLERSQANIQLASQLDRDEVPAWLANNTRLLIPILAQGEGLLVGLTRDSVTVGLVDVYRTTEVPGLTESSRGRAQTEQAQVVAVLDDFEHFNTFLRDASAYGDNQNPMAAKPMVFRDSLILTNDQNQRVWQTKATHATVRNFFAPLGMDSASYVVSQNFGGQAESENSIVSFGVKAFAKDKSGVMLYAHEMTHVNDERLLFEGAYGGTAANNPLGANRRQGQGPELYARGLFEPMDNSQTATSTIRPAFNFNTSITIPSGANNDAVDQIQPSEALDTVNKLATYQHKLIKLLMWMEAKEAEAVLTLPEADRLAYFNQVEQVVRPGTAQTPSTNDNFVKPTQAPQTLEDLVRGSYVTATYVANGTNRLGLVQTNGYNFVPLFDGFYGANYAPAGQNTVGDISFKRNAHEILGWYGFDAMIDYLSGKSSSDQDFLTKLRARQAGEATTLDGKVEADPQATKLKQYQELLKLDLQDVPDDIKAIFTESTLKQAIQADLAVLKQPNVTDGTVYASAVNVRKLKQNLLSQLIETTEMMDTDPAKQVLGEKTYDVIYVANGATGNGETAQTPMGNLTEALAKVRENGRIVLVGDVTERTPVTINKALTIEGSQADRALLLNQDLTITKPVTLKGLTLQLNKESQATGLIKAQADLTLDGVSTKISDRQEGQRPAILLEGDQPVSLQVLNNRDTKLAYITAQTAATIELDRGVSVTGSVTAATSEPVTVTSRTNFASQFAGESLNLHLDGPSLGQAVLSSIQNLTLTNRAALSLSDDTTSQLLGDLTLNEGTRLNTGNQSLRVRTLDGSGTLIFNEVATFSAGNSRAATQIEVNHRTRAYTDGKVYVTIPNRAVPVTVTLVQRNQNLQPDAQGQFIYRAPYEVYYIFESVHNDRFLPDAVNDLLATFTEQEGVREAKPSQPSPPETRRVPEGDGHWVFDRWEENILGDSQKIYEYTGFWQYVPNPAATYSATYQFIPAPGTNQTLPAELTARLSGKNQVGLEDGSQVGVAGIDTTTYTDIANKGIWTFKGWDENNKTVLGGDVTFVGTWFFETKPWTVSYDFVFEGEAESQFNPVAVMKPAEHQLADLNQLALPTAYTNLVASTDGQGEWQFQGWGQPVANQAERTATLEGRWLYKAYEAMPATTDYVANPEAVVGTTNLVEKPGQAGKRSAFTQRVVQEPTIRVEKVGTKPTVVINRQEPEALYEADPNLAFGADNVLKQAGQPTVTTTTTTYRLENGKAIANNPVVTVETGKPTIYQVGTKPTVKTISQNPETLYEADPNLAFGADNVLKQAGQPTVTTTTTTYRLENGKAVANAPVVTVESGRPTIYRVGTNPTVVETTETLPTVYKSDDQLDVGQPNRVETIGQPKVTRTTTTYRIENGQAVANTPTVSRTAGVAQVEVVGTKPTVVETSEPLPIVYKSDDQLAVGQPNRVETIGQPRVTTTTTTYRIENGQAVANTPTVSRTEGVARVEVVGTKPTVERVETAAQVLYEADDSLEVGSTTALKQTGQPGVSIKTTTFRIENGKAVANDPSLVTESGRPTIYRVGTKPTVVETPEPLPVVYKSDDQLAVGQPNRVETIGQPRVTTTTTTYRIENGQAVANTPTVSRTEGVARVEFVGTEPTVERVETAAQILYEADNSLEVGSANVLKQTGQPGVSIKTTTYRLENGRAVANDPSLVTESGRPTIYRVGTKPTIAETTETLPVIYKSDDQLDVGQPNRVETLGQPRVTTTTTTYRIENGQAVAITPTVSRTAGVAQVEFVGTKPTVERVETAIQILYEADETLEVGSTNVLKQTGQPGVSIKTTTYRLENGKAVANVPVVTAESGRPTIYRVGTKPTVKTISQNPETLYEADPNLAFDADNVLKQAGQPTVTTTTTTYRLENGRAVANTPTVSRTEGVPQVELVGIKPTVERVETAIQILYEADETLEVGSTNVLKQTGQPGVSIKTTTYRLENGRAVANDPSLVTESGRPTIYRVGTKPTVERVETAAQILYEADETLEVGSTNVLKQTGQPGVSIKTTTYRLENGKAVANVPVVTAESGRPTIYRVGTKPTIVEKTEDLQTVYKADDQVAVGQPNRVETIGQPRVTTTTTTYRIENGQAVANTPTVSQTTGVAQVEFVGTKPTVIIETIDLPTIYEDDPTLAVGSTKILKQVGQPTVITTTITYRVENGRAVANAPQVITVLGQAEVQLVGTKQEQNGGSDTAAPLPTFDPSEDSDGDGFNNEAELTAGSDPQSAASVPARQNGGSDTAVPLPTFDPSVDSDGDGFSNGDELTAGSDPNSADSVPDRQNGGSDTAVPLPTFDPSADSDGDGFSNGDELTAGSVPHSAASVPARQNGGSDTAAPLPTFDPSADSDDDGSSNGDELTAGSAPHSAASVPSQEQAKVAPIRLPQDTLVKSLSMVVAERPISESTQSSVTPSSGSRLPKTGDSASLFGLGALPLLTGLTGLVRRQDEQD